MMEDGCAELWSVQIVPFAGKHTCVWLQGVNRSNIYVHNEEKMAESGVENRDDKRKLLFYFF